MRINRDLARAIILVACTVGISLVVSYLVAGVAPYLARYLVGFL